MKNLPFNTAAREPDKDLASLNFVQLYNMNEPEYFRLLFRVVVAVYMNSIYYRRRAGCMVDLFIATFKQYSPARYNAYVSGETGNDDAFFDACDALFGLEITMMTAGSAGWWNLVILLERLLSSDEEFQRIVLGDSISEDFEAHIENTLNAMQSWMPDAIRPNQTSENNDLFTERLLALLSGETFDDADPVNSCFGADQEECGSPEDDDAPCDSLPPLDENITFEEFMKLMTRPTPSKRKLIEVPEYDMGNPEDLKRLFTITVNAYLAFFNIWDSLVCDLGHYDGSLDYAPTQRWLGTVLHRGSDYMLDEQEEAFEDAAEFICALQQDAMDNLVQLVGQILTSSEDTQRAIWGRYYNISPEEAEETLRSMDESLEEFVYDADGELSGAQYLEFIHKLFAEVAEE